ncbi:MAG: S-methyl-5'-thioinosine phosphorylase [Sinobacterium sp.]|nr:S-methyl-5'-thioinosine phosphorylase [Sinobacterium sp.]
MLAFIGGSGLNQLHGAELIEEKQVVTPYGEPSSTLSMMALQGQTVVFLARHGQPHSIAPHAINYRANIAALELVGVTDIIAVNAVGGISEGFGAGVLCVPDNLIDYSYGREQSFFDGQLKPLDHIDFTEPYSAPLRQSILDASADVGKHSPLIIKDHGCHAITQGPRLETSAEIRRCRQDGCDIVGMTGMPEAALARELGINYACLALVVNPAAGVSDALITMDEIHRVLDEGMETIVSIMQAVVSARS